MKVFATIFLGLFCYCGGKPLWAEDELPVISVSIDGGGMRKDWATYPRILLIVWQNGKVLWSEDQKDGGPPFLTSNVTEASVNSVISTLSQTKLLHDTGFRKSWFGPDSTYHSIWLNLGGRQTRVETWHELFERDPNLVAVNGGITSLDGRKREDVVAADTKEFRAFRELWTKIRATTSALIPKSGTKVTETPKLKLPR
jgi:hypothetical protein